MRIFEILLLFIHLGTFILAYRTDAKKVWLGAVGVNLTVFVLHGILEGFRYQMFFSYLFVILFTVYALAKTNNELFARKIPKVIKVITVSFTLMALAFTSLLAYAFPVFSLPKPTGSYDIGVKYFHLIDEKRKDPFLDKSSKKRREVMAKVYYPAKKDESKAYFSYFHHSSELIQLFTKHYGMPSFMLDHLNLVKTNAKENLQISDKKQNYPVVLFSHGAGDSMEVQTTMSENLASHGFIVVAIDHTYTSAATAFPDRVVSAKEANPNNFNTGDLDAVINQIMADDAKFVITKLGELNQGKMDSAIKGRLNLDKIGAIGHSVGGAVAYNLANNDSRVKAAINLDGRVYISPKKDAKNMSPFLMLASDSGFVQSIQKREGLLKKFEDMPKEEQNMNLSMYGSEKEYKKAYDLDQKNTLGLVYVLMKSGNLFTIKGSDHMKYNDIGLFMESPLRELIGIKGEIDPARNLDISGDVISTFFNQHLQDEANLPLDSLLKKYPELQRVNLK
jgi:dienelactone hydrolase